MDFSAAKVQNNHKNTTQCINLSCTIWRGKCECVRRTFAQMQTRASNGLLPFKALVIVKL